MIVITGDHRDSVLQYLAPWFQTIPNELIFLDQFDLGRHWKPFKDGIQYGDQWLPMERVHSVYSRLQPNAKPSRMMDDWVCCLDTWSTKVINRPKDTLSNIAKAYQLSLLEIGPLKLIPYQIIAQQYHPLDTSWIFKSMSGIRSIVNTVPHEQEWVEEPVLFQQRIQGLNIRVHVIQDRLFVCQINSTQVDYRYDDSHTMSDIVLPDDIAKACLNITSSLGLLFSGIDLIKDHDDYYILEVNPQPGFSFFGPVRTLIADYLMEVLCQEHTMYTV